MTSSKARRSDANERTKRQYRRYLKEGKGLDPKTIEHHVRHIIRFEEHIGFQDFRIFDDEIAVKFKNALRAETSNLTGRVLTVATITPILNHLKNFMIWLRSQSGYKSHIRYDDIEYLTLSRKEVRAGGAGLARSKPTMEECRQSFITMPTDSLADLRDRALFAMLMLTGARIDALTTLRIKHVNLDECFIEQCGAEMRTKNSKTFRTHFFPVSDIYLNELKRWYRHLREIEVFGFEDPVFPKKCYWTRGVEFDKGGLTREFYSTGSMLSKTISDTFQRAVGRRYGPYAYRKTLATWATERAETRFEAKIVSLNLGHSRLVTTDECYVHPSEAQRREGIRNLGRKKVE